MTATVSRRLQVYGYRFWMHVYPDLASMRAAGERFNNSQHHDSMAMTQAYEVDGGPLIPVVRFALDHVTYEYVIHEAAHAALGIYGSAVRAGVVEEDDPLSHYNEVHAHLTSGVAVSMLRSLRRCGVLSSWES